MTSLRPLFRSLVRLVALAAMLLGAGAALAANPKPAGEPAKPPQPPQSTAVPPPAPQPPQPPPAKQHLTPKEQADGILGKRVYSDQGEDMGLVTDVLVDKTGQPIAVVIDFGGFLGVGSRKIAVAWDLVHFHPGDSKKPVTVSLQKAELQAAPEYQAGAEAKILGAPTPPKPEPRAPSSDHGAQ